MATLKGLMTTLSKSQMQEQRGEIIYNFTRWMLYLTALS